MPIWDRNKDVIMVETLDGKSHEFKMYRGVEDAIGFHRLMQIYMHRAVMQQQNV